MVCAEHSYRQIIHMKPVGKKEKRKTEDPVDVDIDVKMMGLEIKMVDERKRWCKFDDHCRDPR